MNKKVILDPGHVRGHNPGTVKGYAEGTAMYHYAHRLAGKLRAQGITVGITRATVDDDPGLMERGKMAQGAELFVSLHSNGVDSASAYGVSTFYSIKRDGDQLYAERWCQELAKIINGGTRARGASTRKGGGDWDYYTVIQGAVKVGCPHVFLVEHGFHSNPAECAWLMGEENLETMADLETRLICEIIGVDHDGKMTEPVREIGYVNTPKDTLNVRKNADYRAEKLGELADGSAVEVLETAANGWKRIRQGTLEGWVNGGYLVPRKAEDRVLKLTSPYMRGEDVRATQARLAALGYDPGPADGIFGPKTDAAVKAFQRDHGLTQDGDIGPKTRAALEKA